MKSAGGWGQPRYEDGESCAAAGYGQDPLFQSGQCIHARPRVGCIRARGLQGAAVQVTAAVGQETAEACNHYGAQMRARERRAVLTRKMPR